MFTVLVQKYFSKHFLQQPWNLHHITTDHQDE